MFVCEFLKGGICDFLKIGKYLNSSYNSSIFTNQSLKCIEQSCCSCIQILLFTQLNGWNIYFNLMYNAQLRMNQNNSSSPPFLKKKPEILQRDGDNFSWTTASWDLLNVLASLHKTLQVLAENWSKNSAHNISTFIHIFSWGI